MESQVDDDEQRERDQANEADVEADDRQEDRNDTSGALSGERHHTGLRKGENGQYPDCQLGRRVNIRGAGITGCNRTVDGWQGFNLTQSPAFTLHVTIRSDSQSGAVGARSAAVKPLHTETAEPQPETGEPGLTPWLSAANSLAEFRATGQLAAPIVEGPGEDLLLAGYCGLCKQPTRFRLSASLYNPVWDYFFRESLNCEHCSFNSRMRAALQYVFDVVHPDDSAAVYVTEQVTPLFDYVKGRLGLTIGSELLRDVPRGSERDGVRCEDLQALTFDDARFDLVLSLDVLEHVPDYLCALKEIRRVLKPGGHLVLTAPFHIHNDEHVTLARLLDSGEVEHLTTHPEYHGNALGEPRLSFRTFGWQLLPDLRSAGFQTASIVPYRLAELGFIGGPMPLVVAQA